MITSPNVLSVSAPYRSSDLVRRKKGGTCNVPLLQYQSLSTTDKFKTFFRQKALSPRRTRRTRRKSKDWTFFKHKPQSLTIIHWSLIIFSFFTIPHGWNHGLDKYSPSGIFFACYFDRPEEKSDSFRHKTNRISPHSSFEMTKFMTQFVRRFLIICD